MKAQLLALFDAAVAAAHPDQCLPPHLPAPPYGGRLVIVGAGKAAAAMAVTAERHYRALGVLDSVSGHVTSPYGYADTLAAPASIELASARHPTPDGASVRAAETALNAVGRTTERDLVLVLLSGGASSLWALPAEGIDLAAKTTLTRGLLKSGADIHEMNTVRRHLSRIKGGRLRKATRAPMLTLAISDVPGDDPATIGSGPTVPDPTTLENARAVLAARQPQMKALGLDVPAAIHAALADERNETPKPDDPAFAGSAYRVIATPKQALVTAERLAESYGYQVINLGDAITGEAREVAKEHARLAREIRSGGRRIAILSGGELSVTVRNRNGRGGRSQEYALALAIALEGTAGISALAADTDGIDGGEGKTTDPAGAIVTAHVLSRLRHLDAQNFLDNNDATAFFEAAGGLIARGPTHTNVNDFRVILVDPQPSSRP
ncbi:MAG TPA: glycerate kinase [Hyphomicrobiaceae bacterium]|nr:glycerate kinase [Hyphomicrobiaceae bacterium]